MDNEAEGTEADVSNNSTGFSPLPLDDPGTHAVSDPDELAHPSVASSPSSISIPLPPTSRSPSTSRASSPYHPEDELSESERIPSPSPAANSAPSSGYTSDAGSSTSEVPNSKKRRRKSNKAKIRYKKRMSKQTRDEKREEEKGNKASGGVHVNSAIGKKHVAGSKPIEVPAFSIVDKPPTQAGYVGQRSATTNTRSYKLEDLVGEGSKGFNLLEWDGS